MREDSTMAVMRSTVITASLLALMVFGSGNSARAANDNLIFDGTLVAEPCVLDPDTTNITLDFGTVIDKYLYINGRTHSKPFSIRLLDCDLTLGKTISLTFKGTPDSELTQLLALESGKVRGIAIGIVKADDTPLPINTSTQAYTLIAGSNLLAFKGYIQGKPTALQSKGIVRGDFSATATFMLDYP